MTSYRDPNKRKRLQKEDFKTLRGILVSLVSAFSQKNKTYKISLGVCLSLCVCVCKILVPPKNFQTIYPIDMKFWLHIESYRNSPMPLIHFLNFENCAREKFLKFIFLHLINMEKFSNSYSDSDIGYV